VRCGASFRCFRLSLTISIASHPKHHPALHLPTILLLQITL